MTRGYLRKPRRTNRYPICVAERWVTLEGLCMSVGSAHRCCQFVWGSMIRSQCGFWNWSMTALGLVNDTKTCERDKIHLKHWRASFPTSRDDFEFLICSFSCFDISFTHSGHVIFSLWCSLRPLNFLFRKVIEPCVSCFLHRGMRVAFSRSSEGWRSAGPVVQRGGRGLPGGLDRQIPPRPPLSLSGPCIRPKNA